MSDKGRVLTLPLEMYNADLRKAKAKGKREVIDMLFEVLRNRDVLCSHEEAWKCIYECFDVDDYPDLYQKNFISELGTELFKLEGPE